MGGSSKSSSDSTTDTTTVITTTNTNDTDTNTNEERQSINTGKGGHAVSGSNNTLKLVDPGAFELADTVIRSQTEFIQDAGILLGESFTSFLNLAGKRDDLEFNAREINDSSFSSSRDLSIFADKLPLLGGLVAVGAVGYFILRPKRRK